MKFTVGQIVQEKNFGGAGKIVEVADKWCKVRFLTGMIFRVNKDTLVPNGTYLSIKQ